MILFRVVLHLLFSKVLQKFIINKVNIFVKHIEKFLIMNQYQLIHHIIIILLHHHLILQQQQLKFIKMKIQMKYLSFHHHHHLLQMVNHHYTFKNKKNFRFFFLCIILIWRFQFFSSSSFGKKNTI
jgi:hypothetical protein